MQQVRLVEIDPPLVENLSEGVEKYKYRYIKDRLVEEKGITYRAKRACNNMVTQEHFCHGYSLHMSSMEEQCAAVMKNIYLTRFDEYGSSKIFKDKTTNKSNSQQMTNLFMLK